MNTTLRRRAAAAGATSLALIIVGCTGFAALDAESVDQVDLIGDARVSSTLCLGALVDTAGSQDFEPFGAGPACADEPVFEPPLENLRVRDAAQTTAAAVSTRDASRPTHEDVAEAMLAGIAFHQLLVSYRIPEGAEAPETIEAPVTVPEDVQESADESATLLREIMMGDIFDVPAFVRGVDEEDLVDVEFPETITLTRDDSLSDEMAEKAHAAEGQRWVGYVSEQVPLGLSGRVTVPAQFGLPTPAGDAPYAGPFEHRTMVGRRVAVTEDDLGSLLLMLDLVDFDDFFPYFLMSSSDLRSETRGLIGDEPTLEEEWDPQRAVDCDQDLDSLITGGEATVCGFDAPDGVSDDETLATNDLRVSGGTATAEQGQTASVPFTLRFAGPAATQSLALSGGTTLPFSTATARTTSWTPGANETRTELVDVPVPADARPGDYDVTFAAEVGGQVREAVGRVTVTRAAGVQQPAGVSQQQSLTPQRERLYVGRNGTVAFGYVCPTALGSACSSANASLWGMQSAGGARAAAAKRKLVKLASRTFRAKPGQRVRVKIKVGPKTRRYLVKAGRRMKGRLVVTVGGNRQSRSILLRRG